MNYILNLEQDVQGIYSFLLNMKDEGVMVGRRVIMTGKSGAQHEVDVYYEFEKAGLRHRVAIECKDWSSPVSKGQIQEFESKIRDIGSIVGVVISKNGYQSGAEVFAKHHDISLLKFDDLPKLNMLIGERLKTVALPDESYIGEPFWIIMEMDNGTVTGSHYGQIDPATGKGIIPLLFYKAHAELLMKRESLDPAKWAVRGLPKYAFRAFLAMLRLYERDQKTSAAICFLQPDADTDTPFLAILASSDSLAKDYDDGELELPSFENPVPKKKWWKFGR